MRAAIVLVAAGALVGLLAGLAVAAAAGGRDDRTLSEFEVRPTVDDGPQGVAMLTYDGGRLRGRIVVWGLEPESVHAVHFHGPDSSCGEQADPVAIHPDLEADGAGVATVEVDVETPTNVLGSGFYYNVHEGPSSVADNPEIACGDTAPGA